jgi:hypothetical protein
MIQPREYVPIAATACPECVCLIAMAHKVDVNIVDITTRAVERSDEGCPLPWYSYQPIPQLALGCSKRE